MKSWWSRNKRDYAFVGGTRRLIIDYLEEKKWDGNAWNVVKKFKRNTQDQSVQWVQIWNGLSTLYKNHSEDTIQSCLLGNSK